MKTTKRVNQNIVSWNFWQRINNFLLVVKNDQVTEFEYVFAKRLRTTFKKFLDNRSKRFANTTETFFDKRGLQKFEFFFFKFIYVFGQIDEFVNNFLELLIFKINVPSTFWMVDFQRFLSHQEVFKYSLSLSFGWKCNDTPSLKVNFIKKNFLIKIKLKKYWKKSCLKNYWKNWFPTNFCLKNFVQEIFV